MSQSDKLREQIDACRAGSDDLALPELGELAQAAENDRAVAAELARSHEFDRAIMSAMHDVSVPAGLLDRLLAATTVTPASATTGAADNAVAPTKNQNITRRNWLVAGSSLALVALVAWSASYVWLRPRPVVSQDELSVAVSGWLNDLPETWNTEVPVKYQDPALLRKPLSWQTFRAPDGTGRTAWISAINLTPPTGPRAVLFVIPTRAQYRVPSGPDTTMRLSLSRGYTGTAWQRKSTNYLFVLVVESSGGQQLDQYLRRSIEA